MQTLLRFDILRSRSDQDRPLSTVVSGGKGWGGGHLWDGEEAWRVRLIAFRVDDFPLHLNQKIKIHTLCNPLGEKQILLPFV